MFNCLLYLKPVPQIWQVCGIPPVCMNICLTKSALSQNSFRHTPHITFSLVWKRKCFLKADLDCRTLLHASHTYGLLRGICASVTWFTKSCFPKKFNLHKSHENSSPSSFLIASANDAIPEDGSFLVVVLWGIGAKLWLKSLDKELWLTVILEIILSLVCCFIALFRLFFAVLLESGHGLCNLFCKTTVPTQFSAIVKGV